MTFWAFGVPLGTMDIRNCQSLMQILFLRATAGLKTKFEANWAQNYHFGPPGPPWGPPWAPLETMDIRNCQILMQILSLHPKIGLQTKFEANWKKNETFNPSKGPIFRGPWMGPPLGNFYEKWLLQ